MVRSRQFKNLVTALKKEGFTTVHWFETSTTINRGYYCIRLANKKISVLIYDGMIYGDNIQVFVSLTKEYNKLGDCAHYEMPKTSEELNSLIVEIKNFKTQYPHLKGKWNR